jgi:hypothetical protein
MWLILHDLFFRNSLKFVIRLIEVEDTHDHDEPTNYKQVDQDGRVNQ